MKNRRPAANKPSVVESVSWGPLILLVTVVAVYLFAFYMAVPHRLEYFRTLLLPDEVWLYWTNFTGWPSLLDRIPIWLVTAWYLVAAWSAGSLVIRALKLTDVSGLERLLFAISLGLSLLSTATLLIGLIGGLRFPWLFRAIAIALPALELFLARHAFRQADFTAKLDCRRLLLIFAFALLAAPYLLAGTLPPTEFDVCEYHLQVPKEWFREGAITFLPHNVYGNMPLGAEMHALLCMELWLGDDAWWHGALAGKLVICLFGPLTALAIFTAGRRWFSATGGAIAAAVYLSFPWIAHVSFNGLVDGVLAHYVFLAVYVAMLTGLDGRKQLLAGLFIGAAAATKYPGLIFTLPPVLVIIAVRSWLTASVEARVKQTAWAVLLVSLGTFVTGSAWYAKNLALTGNPVYPLAGDVFGGQTRTPEKIEQWNRAHQVPRDVQGNRYSLAQLLAAKKQVGLASEWLSPIAWPLAIVGIIAAWRRRELQMLLAVVVWIFAVWFFATHRIDRFWLPAVPLLVLMISAAWRPTTGQIYHRVLTGVSILGILAAMLMIIAPIFIDERPIAVSDPRWLASLQRLRTPQLESHQILNAETSEGDAVLLVGDAQPFDLVPQTYYNTCFDDSILEVLVKDQSPDDIRQAFADRRIAYVLVDWAEIRRYRSPGNYGFTDFVQPEVFERLIEQGVLAPSKWKGENEGQIYWEIYPVHTSE